MERKDIDLRSLSILQLKLLKILKESGGLKRSELVKKLGIARTTIYDNLNKLKQFGMIKNYEKYIGIRGRPFVIWEVI